MENIILKKSENFMLYLAKQINQDKCPYFQFLFSLCGCSLFSALFSFSYRRIQSIINFVDRFLIKNLFQFLTLLLCEFLRELHVKCYIKGTMQIIIFKVWHAFALLAYSRAWPCHLFSRN